MLACLLASCGSDDESSPPPERSIEAFCDVPLEVRAALSHPVVSVPRDYLFALSAVSEMRDEFDAATQVAPDEILEHVKAAADFMATLERAMHAAETTKEIQAVARGMVDAGVEFDEEHAMPLLKFQSRHCPRPSLDPASE
jgi:hypothetical protein